MGPKGGASARRSNALAIDGYPPHPREKHVEGIALDAPTKDRTPLLTLYAANAISLIGSQMTLVALPWFVLQTTGSVAKTGGSVLGVAVPQVLSGFLSGALVDRLGYKRMSIVADLAAGAAMALIPLLHGGIGLPFWALLLLIFASNTLNTPGTTARQSMLPDLAALSGAELTRANAWYQSILNLSMVLGPVLAGVLIGVVDPSAALWVDGASFGCSAVLIWLATPPTGHIEVSRAPYLAQVREGLAYILGDRVVRAVTLMGTASVFFGNAWFTVFLPVFVAERFADPVALGLIRAGFGLGLLLSTLLLGIVTTRVPRRLVYIGAYVASGFPLYLIYASHAMIAAVVALTMVGLTFGPVNPIRAAVIQERTPAALRGRVVGTSLALLFGAYPLGVLAYSVALARWGVQFTLAASLIGYSILALSALLNPVLRRIDAR
jgi:MFS family permease